MNARQLLSRNSEQYCDKPAIIFNEQTITFGDLFSLSSIWSKALSQSGINKGDKVAVFLPNCPEYIYSYLAIFSKGAVIVPLDFMLKERETINFINHSDSVVLIAMEKKGISLKTIKQACPQLQKVIFLKEESEGTLLEDEGFVPLRKILQENSEFDDVPIDDQDDAAIFYTSGSTGHPKGVLLSYGNLDNPIKSIEHFLKPTDQDSYLCAGVPFSHVGGLDYMLFMLSFASTLILMDRFHPFESLKNIARYKPTIFCIVPAMFVAILSIRGCDQFDISSLRYAVVFGAPSSPELLKRFQSLCPNTILLNGWGMTETSAPNTYSPEDISKISSIGQFGIGLEARIVDEQGLDVAQGGRGELLVKGDAMMKEYYKEPELTKSVMTADGWFKTGDIVRKDEDGLYYIVGRIKDMIKVAGEIVFASEVEEVLHRHPKIKEVAVIGVFDKLRGEAIKAYVVRKQGEELSAEDIRYFGKENMAHFKIPSHIEFKEDLPKNRTGKIDKELLKERGSVCQQ